MGAFSPFPKMVIHLHQLDAIVVVNGLALCFHRQRARIFNADDLRHGRQKGTAMQCVNPACGQDAENLHTGTLRMLELAIPPEERVVWSDSGFPVVVVPSRYFWLCSRCSRMWRMRRWTPAGLLLEPNRPDRTQEQTLQTVKVAPAREVFLPRRRMASQSVA